VSIVCLGNNRLTHRRQQSEVAFILYGCKVVDVAPVVIEHTQSGITELLCTQQLCCSVNYLLTYLLTYLQTINTSNQNKLHRNAVRYV